MAWNGNCPLLKMRSLLMAATVIAVVGSAHAQYTASLLPTPASSTLGHALAGYDGQQVGTTSATVGRAILWNNVSGSTIDLTVGGHGATAYAAYAGLQGGEFIASIYRTVGSGRGGGGSRTYYIPHAALWHGSAQSVVDLNPAGAYRSVILGMSGSKQVGWQSPSYNTAVHATLWSNTASSAVNIEPAGYSESEAVSMSGTKQAGFGYLSASGTYHALLWTGTAASAIDLDPTNFIDVASYALSVDSTKNQQAGYVYIGSTSSLPHACLWAGSAGSAVDLNPAAFSGSEALAVRGGYQAGLGFSGSTSHALVWKGTATSAIDLHTFLPTRFLSSQANGIDADGSIVGSAYDGSTTYGVVWKPSSKLFVTVSQDVAPGATGWSNHTTTLTVDSPYATASTIYYKLNTGATQSVAGNVATVPISTSGAYTVQVYATSGTHKTTTQYYTANVDVDPPVTTGGYTGFTLTLAATDVNSGVANTSYILDGGATINYTGPIALQNTAHTLEYWSTDVAGNVETHHVVSLAAVAPTLSSIAPTSVLTGGPDLTLSLTGAGFISTSYVQWNGVALQTTYLSSTSLQATVPASYTASAGTVTVTVVNPSPGTGTSNGQTFAILQQAVATGGVAAIQEAGQANFDISPLTSHSGFTPSGTTVHIVATANTTFQDKYGNGMTQAVFFDTIQDGMSVTVTGSYDPATKTLTAWSVKEN